MYLQALIAGAPRVNLQGRTVGVVSADQAEQARKSLEALLERRTQKAEEVQSTRGRLVIPASDVATVTKINDRGLISEQPSSLADLRKAAPARKAAKNMFRSV
jgi:sRNA-binding protein